MPGKAAVAKSAVLVLSAGWLAVVSTVGWLAALLSLGVPGLFVAFAAFAASATALVIGWRHPRYAARLTATGMLLSAAAVLTGAALYPMSSSVAWALVTLAGALTAAGALVALLGRRASR